VQTLIPVILLGGLAYFMLIRPQRRMRSQRQNMMSAISPGDEIITIGGMHGAVRDVDDETVDVEISEGVIVRFERRAVAAITKDVPADQAEQYRIGDDTDESDDVSDQGLIEAPEPETAPESSAEHDRTSP
jgi:preprotein translocase subunit YajC